jgi:hypothetical protein
VQPAHITTNVSSATNVWKTDLTLFMKDKPHLQQRSPHCRRGLSRRACGYPSLAQLEGQDEGVVNMKDQLIQFD